MPGPKSPKGRKPAQKAAPEPEPPPPEPVANEPPQPETTADKYAHYYSLSHDPVAATKCVAVHLDGDACVRAPVRLHAHMHANMCASMYACAHVERTGAPTCATHTRTHARTLARTQHRFLASMLELPDYETDARSAARLDFTAFALQ